MTTTPTIVLVHGAFGDSAMWRDVAAGLRSYRAVAVANPLRGLESDAQYVAAVTKAVDSPVVLVGHPYGGSVITRAARDASNVESFRPEAVERFLRKMIGNIEARDWPEVAAKIGRLAHHGFEDHTG